MARPENKLFGLLTQIGCVWGDFVLFLFSLFPSLIFFFFSLWKQAVQGSFDIAQNDFSFSPCSTVLCEILFSKEVNGSRSLGGLELWEPA